MLSLLLLLLQRHCTMYESSDKDEEGKRQGTRKSEADEEDGQLTRPDQDRFLPNRLFFLFSASIFFPSFFFFSLQLLAVAWGGMGWHGWRGRLWSFVCRLKCIYMYKRISNVFKTHCHKHISGAFRRRSEMLSKAFPATRLRCVGNAFETRSNIHLKRAFSFCCSSRFSWDFEI